MAPHIDATAIALLALRSEPKNELTDRSRVWLEHQSCSRLTPWSLAWSILALDAYDKPVAAMQQRLTTLTDPDGTDDAATLAAVALALHSRAFGNPFEVVV